MLTEVLSNARQALSCVVSIYVFYINVFLYLHFYFQDSTMRQKGCSHASSRLRMLKQKEDEVVF